MPHRLPIWLGKEIKFDSLIPGYKEFMCRRVGYDVYYGGIHGEALPVTRKSLPKVKEWICQVGNADESWIWAAFGFAGARAVDVFQNNLDLMSHAQFIRFVTWIKQVMWVDMVANNMLNDPNSMEEFFGLLHIELLKTQKFSSYV